MKNSGRWIVVAAILGVACLPYASAGCNGDDSCVRKVVSSLILDASDTHRCPTKQAECLNLQALISNDFAGRVSVKQAKPLSKIIRDHIDEYFNALEKAHPQNVKGNYIMARGANEAAVNAARTQLHLLERKIAGLMRKSYQETTKSTVDLFNLYDPSTI